MSDQWGHYFCDMAGHSASIVFDDGISSEIDNIKLQHSLKMKIRLRDFRHNGFPTNEEGDRLAKLDREIENVIQQNNGVYLGRVTTNGVRWVLALIGEDQSSLAGKLKSLAQNAAYEVECFIENDPKKSVYWEDLYPTVDDRRVMNDLSVLNALADRGDIQESQRPVDHWIYFSSKHNAEAFAKWAHAEGYVDVRAELTDQDAATSRQWCVRLVHHGTMLLSDITKHTLRLTRSAKEHGGDYDGWETMVVKSE